MTREIQDALRDAVRRLDDNAFDIAIPDDLSALSHGRTASISITWKSDDQLHLGNFAAFVTSHSGNETRILEALEESGIPVPKVVTTGSSDGVTAVLAHLFDGEPLDEVLASAGMRWEISATAFAYARMLARIHALDWTKVAPWMEDPESVPEDIIDAQIELEFTERSTRLLELPPDWRPFVQRVVDWLDLRRPVEVSLCICHGRYRPENIYAFGEDITAILDWQHARVTDASSDLALLPVWLSEIGLSVEDAELFAQAAHGAYLQASPRGLGNTPYYSVSLPLDDLIDRLSHSEDPDSDGSLEVIKGTIERAMVLAGRVPWKSR